MQGVLTEADFCLNMGVNASARIVHIGLRNASSVNHFLEKMVSP